MVLAGLRAGARGYRTKDVSAEEIRQALSQVRQGQAVIDPAVRHHVVNAIADAPALSGRPRARVIASWRTCARAPRRERRPGALLVQRDTRAVSAG